ncbi:MULTISPECIES: GTP-sensing pleiotropic transcriptional regulator CodY [unclassified Dehalobacter]|uniref:GTP-sensing pleiotropic transcriptional regulator CodY n=1 Tax=unclassified Dehalobacter TaxID=2635733 RepID=UPI000E6C99AE|nr:MULTISPECIES: GTP-sensing pleiotropic transcriptional regulator CodY [unclassified Dehalobacter]RJE49162.1 transcriptional repressor CodY [Dehalobacter sp. MCB1]TCX49446.1 GTP-sensing pleiotropic transcriptional regulator CodY [Dehalobacter sp. 12DCB1]TCX53200.1 GTP-sensing pleiotropic transcriptional regulator CodY [Dehalobacter sp. 14DCB1]
MEIVLEKTRKISGLIQRAAGKPVDFDEMAKVLSQEIAANCYIVGRRGKILGYSFMDDFHCGEMEQIVLHSERFPESYNEGLLKTTETKANTTQIANACVFSKHHECVFGNKMTTVVPILGGGDRVGTLVLAKFGEQFRPEDLILAEYGATVIGMEILRVKAEYAEEEARKKAAVQIAVGTLSYSELEAVEHIFAELGGGEGLLVASKIADRVGITRSVIVNALRKFESAGVIESKSLGMKGTYIKVLNDYLLDELDKYIKRHR